MQIHDVTMVNDACAVLAKAARRSVEKHEARIVELKKLIALVDQFGGADPAEFHANEVKDKNPTTDVLRTALDSVTREEQRANVKVVGQLK